MTQSTNSALASFEARVPITVRLARRRDLRPLEWLGMFLTHRAFIEDAFARQLRGEVLMLLAVAREFPVGQLWIGAHFVGTNARALGRGLDGVPAVAHLQAHWERHRAALYEHVGICPDPAADRRNSSNPPT